jgi:RNA polymerase sigma-H factor
VVTPVERVWTPKCEAIARAVAREYHAPPGLTWQDMLQEARIGVWKALSDFRPGAGSGFNQFARMCATRQVITAIKTATRRKHEVLNRAASYDAPAPDDEVGLGERLVWRDGEDPLRIVIAREEVRRLLARMRALTPWERECVERCELLGLAYDAVGDAKSVDNALQRARKKLREERLPVLERRRLRVYVDRTVFATGAAASAEAMKVQPGRVVGMRKCKLLDGQERASQGRRRADGRLGQPVWRVEIEAEVPVAA